MPIESAEVTAACDDCDDVVVVECDWFGSSLNEYEVRQQLARDGWLVVGSKCFCPECRGRYEDDGEEDEEA